MFKFFKNLFKKEESFTTYGDSEGNTLYLPNYGKKENSRIWNINIGKLPKDKAEKYISELIKKYKEKVEYNPETGEVKVIKENQNEKL